MEYELTYPENYRNICLSWLQTVKRRESATWIFPPLSGVHFLVRQFLQDTDLHKEILHEQTASYIFTFNILNQSAHLSQTDIENELYGSICEQHDGFAEALTLEDVIKSAQKEGLELVFLIHGIDGALKAHNWDLLAHLYQLAQKWQNIHYVLLLWTDATDPEIFPSISRYTPFIQNIHIQPRRSQREGKKFMEYLKKEWGVILTQEQEDWIQKNCDGSLRLTKEVFRYIQDNPGITSEGIANMPALKFKIQALLDNFLEDQREVILRVAHNEQIPENLTHAYTYLKTIRWVIEDKKPHLAIPYVYNVIEQSSHDDNTSSFSKTEASVFSVLKEHISHCVSRDDIAKAMWNDAENSYSD